MPVEIIGEAGTPGASREWINAECEMAVKHLKACLLRTLDCDTGFCKIYKAKTLAMK